MNNISIVLVGLFLILVSGISAAGPDRFEKKGFISNDTGEKCWYQQRILDG